MTAVRPRQLVLQFQLDDNATFENFIPTPQDRQVLTLLGSWQGVMEYQFVYLWGAPGVGKTHLLQALCHRLAATGGNPIYIPLTRREQLAPAIFEGLESLELICLDGIDRLAGDSEWEQALFGLYNRARDSGARMVFSAGTPPSSLPVDLPDLLSRLQASMIFQLHELSDAGKADLLKHRARQSGFTLSDQVIEYILQRNDRRTPALIEVLKKLDHQSLEQKRRITIPLVKQAMDW